MSRSNITDIIIIGGAAYALFLINKGGRSLIDELRFTGPSPGINQDTGRPFTDRVLRKQKSVLTPGATVFQTSTPQGIVTKKTQTVRGFLRNPFLLFEKPLF